MSLYRIPPVRGPCKTAQFFDNLPNRQYCHDHTVVVLTIVPEPIPLCTTLRIQRDYIVIHRHGSFVEYSVLQSLSPKWRVRNLVQWPVQRYPDPFPYLTRCCANGLWRKQVEPTQLIVRSPETPSIAWGAVLIQGQVVECRELLWGHSG